MPSSERVRPDDLLAPLAELSDRDFLESLPNKARIFIEKFDRQFREDSLYYRQTLINDTFDSIEKANAALEEGYPNLGMTGDIQIVFKNYKQLISLFKIERQRLVSALKEYAEIIAEATREQEERETMEEKDAKSG